jgi:hypothetical protein
MSSSRSTWLGEHFRRRAIVPEIRVFEIANSIFVSYSNRKRIKAPQNVFRQ